MLREAEPEPDPTDADKPTAWERTKSYALRTFSGVAVVSLLGLMISLLWFNPRQPYGTLAAKDSTDSTNQSRGGMPRELWPGSGSANDSLNRQSGLIQRPPPNASVPGGNSLSQEEWKRRHEENMRRHNELVEKARQRRAKSDQTPNSSDPDSTETKSRSDINPFRRMSDDKAAEGNESVETDGTVESGKQQNPFRRVQEENESDESEKPSDPNTNPFKKSTSRIDVGPIDVNRLFT